VLSARQQDDLERVLAAFHRFEPSLEIGQRELMGVDAPHVDRPIRDVPDRARIAVRPEVSTEHQSTVVSSVKTLNSMNRPSLRIIFSPMLTIGA
jgi:hypothetical protein